MITDTDIVRTFTLSHHNQSETVDEFIKALTANNQIDLKWKENILEEHRGSREENTRKLLKYAEQMTGVLLVCSTDMAQLLDAPSKQETSVDIQLTGEDVLLDANTLRKGIESSDKIKQKIIVVNMPEEDECLPEWLREAKSVQLSYENLDALSNGDKNAAPYDIWVSELIVPRLQEKVRKVVPQLSVDES